MRWVRRHYVSAAVAVVVVALGILIAGCGSSSSTSTAASDAKGGDAPLSAAELTQVQAAIKPHLNRATSLGIDAQPVASVPKGKTIYYVYQAHPVATLTYESAREAARLLGWKLKPLVTGQTPEAAQQAFETALRDPATDGIISTALAVTVVAKQLKEAAAKHVPVAILNPDARSSNELIAIAGPDSYGYVGKLEADYVLSRTQGRGRALLALPAAFPTVKILGDAFKDEWAKMCHKCDPPLTYDAPLTSFGKDFPSLLTAYLQAHRDVKYIAFGFNDMMIGVPAALQGAGLTGIKAITWAQGPETNSMIGGPLLEADVSNPIVEFPWVAMDAMLRSFNRQTTAPDSAFLGPGTPLDWFITKEGMEAAGLDPNKMWPIDADYVEQFKKLWGMTP